MTDQCSRPRFSYANYESAIRGPNYDSLRQISRETAKIYRGCRRVLDVASGQGFLLDALREESVPAVGVDNEPTLVQKCRERGLEVVQDDVMQFLATTQDRFDGLNCTHLIEHLPYESLLDLIEGAHRVLLPGGVFIIRWPNPRSAPTQLLSFWRDPTHVRFYDGDFVQAVLAHYGFEVFAGQYDRTARLPHPAQIIQTLRTAARLQQTAAQDGAGPPAPTGRLTGLRRRVRNAILSAEGGSLRPQQSVAADPTPAERVLASRQRRLWLGMAFSAPLEAILIARRGA